MSIAVSESMIGLKITTIQGNKEKVIDVTSSGYKLETRRGQVKAKQLVKKGKAYIEIERPGAKQIRDTGMGYVEIIDPELYLEVMGKKMPKALLKEIEGDEPAKKSKSKSKAKSKAKTEKKKSSKSKSKSKSKAKAEKPAKESKPKAKKREDLELLGDHGLRVPEGLRSVVASAIKNHLTENFNTPGPVRVVTEMDVFSFIGEDGAVGAMNIGIHFDLPEVEAPVITEKTMQKVKAGLWEKNEKLRALCFKKFGTDFQIHDVFVDEDGEEYIFAGANVAKKKPILVFHRPEDEKCISTPIDAAVARLELAPTAQDLSEEDFDELDELDLVDGDELEETVQRDRASLIDEEALEEFETEEEFTEYFNDFDVAVLVDFFNSAFEGATRREQRVIDSGDKTAIVELLVSLHIEEDGSDADLDSGEFSDEDLDADFDSGDDVNEEADDADELDDGEFEDDLSDDSGEEVDADSDSDDTDEIEDLDSELDDLDSDEELEDTYSDSDDLEGSDDDENPAFDLDDEVESEEEAGLTQDDLDDMLDALIEGEHVTNREARRLSDEQILDLYNEHFPQEEAEEEVEMDVDDMLDALLDAEVLTAKKARRMDDDEIIALYNEHINADESGEEVEDDELELTDEDADTSDDLEDDGDEDLSDFDDDELELTDEDESGEVDSDDDDLDLEDFSEFEEE